MGNYLEIISLGISLVAVLFTVVYFLEPKFKIKEIYKQDSELKVNIQNGNCVFKIVDIYCEIAISVNEKFDIVKTLELQKNHTLSLSKKKSENYVFRTINFNERYQNEKLVRIRLMAPNILGIKKVTTIIKKISDFKEI